MRVPLFLCPVVLYTISEQVVLVVFFHGNISEVIRGLEDQKKISYLKKKSKRRLKVREVSSASSGGVAGHPTPCAHAPLRDFRNQATALLGLSLAATPCIFFQSCFSCQSLVESRNQTCLDWLFSALPYAAWKPLVDKDTTEDAEGSEVLLQHLRPLIKIPKRTGPSREPWGRPLVSRGNEAHALTLCQETALPGRRCGTCLQAGRRPAGGPGAVPGASACPRRGPAAAATWSPGPVPAPAARRYSAPTRQDSKVLAGK
ncbi:uncharacterized protein LOC135178460 [Pogoniulus pusillus]|uniref:uncharacterized protein LOC135178460 n=1 Tax=Pogoniulus pusillus TaxID=488313 RepID=UPI0030B97D7D